MATFVCPMLFLFSLSRLLTYLFFICLRAIYFLCVCVCALADGMGRGTGRVGEAKPTRTEHRLHINLMLILTKPPELSPTRMEVGRVVARKTRRSGNVWLRGCVVAWLRGCVVAWLRWRKRTMPR
jgi:hypothetical protein